MNEQLIIICNVLNHTKQTANSGVILQHRIFNSEQGFFRGVGGGICPPLPWLWLAPLGYAEISILHINLFKRLIKALMTQ